MKMYLKEEGKHRKTSEPKQIGSDVKQKTAARRASDQERRMKQEADHVGVSVETGLEARTDL